jgi:hypothetical protein
MLRVTLPRQQPPDKSGPAQDDQEVRPVALADEIRCPFYRLIGGAARRCPQVSDQFI